jgi:hypothetical protein
MRLEHWFYSRDGVVGKRLTNQLSHLAGHTLARIGGQHIRLHIRIVVDHSYSARVALNREWAGAGVPGRIPFDPCANFTRS